MQMTTRVNQPLSLWFGGSTFCLLRQEGFNCAYNTKGSHQPKGKKPKSYQWQSASAWFFQLEVLFPSKFPLGHLLCFFWNLKNWQRNPLTDQKLTMSKNSGNSDSTGDFTRIIVSSVLDKPKKKNSLGTNIYLWVYEWTVSAYCKLYPKATSALSPREGKIVPFTALNISEGNAV